MMLSSFIVSSALIVGLAYYMYIPDNEIVSNITYQTLTSKFKAICAYISDAFFSSFHSSAPEMKSREDGVLTTHGSIAGVDVIIHRPMGSRNGDLYPGIIYFHGGGWISGSTGDSSFKLINLQNSFECLSKNIARFEFICRQMTYDYKELTEYLSKISGFVVISVEYRLAPEFPFPAAFEDCLSVTLSVLRNPPTFGFLADKVTLAGDDVGGNLALSVSLNITKEEPLLSKEIRLIGIFYSPLQAFDFNLPSYAKNARQPGQIGKEDIVEQFSLYLFGENNTKVVNQLMKNLHTSREQKNSERAQILDLNMLPFSFRDYSEPELSKNAGNEQLSRDISHLILDDRVSPMLASIEHLENLPYTYFISPEVDPVRDESFMFYAALRELDMNKNEHAYYREQMHGFLLQFQTNDIARKAIKEFIAHVKMTLARER